MERPLRVASYERRHAHKGAHLGSAAPVSPGLGAGSSLPGQLACTQTQPLSPSLLMYQITLRMSRVVKRKGARKMVLATGDMMGCMSPGEGGKLGRSREALMHLWMCLWCMDTCSPGKPPGPPLHSPFLQHLLCACCIPCFTAQLCCSACETPLFSLQAMSPRAFVRSDSSC